MTTKSSYSEQFKKKLNSYDPVMNIWIYALLIYHVEKIIEHKHITNLIKHIECKKIDHPKRIIDRKPISFNKEIVKDVENLTSLKEVRRITITNITRLIEQNIRIELDREEVFQKLIEYMETNIDIIFDQKLRRFLNLIEDDKSLAYFYELKTSFYLDEEKKNIIKQFNEIEKLEDSESIGDLYSFLPRLPAALDFNTVNIRANKNILSEIDYEELTSISRGHFLLFEYTLEDYNNIQKISKKIIKNKIADKHYTEWLFDYISRKVDIEHIPHTLEEKRSFIISQLNFWYLISPDAYNQILKRIQSSWNKREFDKRPKSERKKIAKKSELPKEDSQQPKTKLPFKIRRTPV